jgi:hypothetical protein
MIFTSKERVLSTANNARNSAWVSRWSQTCEMGEERGVGVGRHVGVEDVSEFTGFSEWCLLFV